MVHEGTKVVTEEVPADSELPGGGGDEDLTGPDERCEDDNVQSFRDKLVVWVFRDGFLGPGEEGTYR